jgi:hypothetical protein
LLSRLAKSWRARQADILTRHANGGCSNGCTGAINLLIRRSSASARFRSAGMSRSLALSTDLSEAALVDF